MKTIFVSILSFLTLNAITCFLSSPSMAGEFTGAGIVREILKKQNMNLNSYLNSGNKLLLGKISNLSGVSLSKVQVFIAKKTAFKKSKITHIEYLQNSNNLSLNTLRYFESNNTVIYAGEIDATLVKYK